MASPVITLDLEMPPDLALIPVVRNSIRDAVVQTDSLPATRLSDLDLAVVEMLNQAIGTNIVRGEETTLRIKVELSTNPLHLLVEHGDESIDLDIYDINAFDQQ